jgi:hypothetical protein
MKMILLFSHKITKEQVEDAKKSLGVDEFVKLDDKTLSLWSNIPTDIQDISKHLKPIKDFILRHASNGDYILIQGDFGAVVKMIYFARAKGLIPVYSTTKREVKEEFDGDKVKKVSLFKHILFRKY